MSTRTADPAAERRRRIQGARRARPEAAAWLDLLELALDAAERAPWSAVEPRLPAAADGDAPLLHDAFVAVDRGAARRWVRRVLRAAAASGEAGAVSLARLRGRALDPLAFLAAGAGHDDDAFRDLAAAAGAGPGTVATVARIAALPLLHGCAAALASRRRAGWTAGHCPVCGGWPALAELRGLERTRVLRCARCAAGWELPVLVCAFCGERDHQRQYSFAPDGEELRRRVDVCRSCDGYLKTLTTLAPLPPWAVPLEDLATLELDLVAGERGLARPETPGYPTALRVVAAGAGFGHVAGGWA